MSETALKFPPRLRAHLAIARLDHSIKNLFVLPGVIVPLSVYSGLWSQRLVLKLVLAFVAITLVACSNYVINEVLDASFDRLHPIKRNRPAALGLVSIPAAYAQWLLMMLAGVAIGLTISRMFALMALLLWIMGCLYNFPPIRTKDVPYLDVLTESINNPLRMLLGWYAVTALMPQPLVPPVSLLISYWMIGCYFMALKRFSELSEIGDRTAAAAYRASFKRYTPESLLVSIVFYASTAMLFLGAFIMRYRIELILGFPLVALVMAIYLKLSFQKNSAVQNPEKLYREPLLMVSFIATVLVMSLLLFIRLPRLEQFFVPTLPQDHNAQRRPPSRMNEKRPTLLAALFLILTAIISLLWSHHKLMSQDEFFVLQTDNAVTVSQLVHIQRTTPISLDPLTYHLLAHASMRVFGANAFALRLPSFLGYLLMQVCLFIFVRRIAGGRAAIFALAFPALTATLFYSAEARPYGLLLGLYALTLVAWQSTIRENLSFRNAAEESASAPAQIVGTINRWLNLALLTLSIALTLNAHYFGVLLLIPLCAAELARTIRNRRIDFPVAAAIILGMAAIVFALPFQSAAAEFRQHYYNGGAVGVRAISQAYRSLFVDYTHTSPSTQRCTAILFVLCALALIAACVQRYRNRTIALPFPESVFILVLAALPFFGFLLARFVTHSIEVRYVLGAIIGITVLLAVVLTPTLRRNAIYGFSLSILFVAILATGLYRIHTEARASDAILTSLILSPQQKAALLASPTQLLYIQDMGHFEVASYYEPDPIVASRMALLYSRDEELHWDGHDTVSLTAMHMRAVTGFAIVPWDQLRNQPGPHVLILIHGGWDWTDQALVESHAQITPLGSALNGDAVSVRFP